MTFVHNIMLHIILAVLGVVATIGAAVATGLVIWGGADSAWLWLWALVGAFLIAGGVNIALGFKAASKTML